jgi:hypothetical protein
MVLDPFVMEEERTDEAQRKPGSGRIHRLDDPSGCACLISPATPGTGHVFFKVNRVALQVAITRPDTLEMTRQPSTEVYRQLHPELYVNSHSGLVLTTKQ